MTTMADLEGPMVVADAAPVNRGGPAMRRISLLVTLVVVLVGVLAEICITRVNSHLPWCPYVPSVAPPGETYSMSHHRHHV